MTICYCDMCGKRVESLLLMIEKSELTELLKEIEICDNCHKLTYANVAFFNLSFNETSFEKVIEKYCPFYYLLREIKFPNGINENGVTYD